MYNKLLFKLLQRQHNIHFTIFTFTNTYKSSKIYKVSKAKGGALI